MHFREQCKHGLVVRQCRCPGGVLTIVPCPPHCNGKAEDELKLYDWEKEERRYWKERYDM